MARDHDLTDRGLVTETGQVRHLDLDGDPLTGPDRVTVGVTEHDLVLGGIRPTGDPVGTEVDQLDLEVGVGVGPVDRELELVGVPGVYHRRRLDRELGHVGDLLDCIRYRTGPLRIGHGADATEITGPPGGSSVNHTEAYH